VSQGLRHFGVGQSGLNDQTNAGAGEQEPLRQQQQQGPNEI
jgi:hypothetical protein